MRNRFILACIAVAFASTIATSQDVINPQTDASKLTAGALPAGRLPAFSGGDVTSSAGSVNLAIGATKVTSAMLNADVFSTAHSWGGVQTFTAPILGAASATNVAVTGSTVPANGIYLPAANVFGLAANSVSRLQMGPSLGRSAAFDSLLIGAGANYLEIRGTATSGSSTFIDFDNSADTQLGNITCNQATSSCLYNSGSDIRGKPHREPIVGASAAIDALRVYNFDFPENSIRGFGVAAQEAVNVIPSMVTRGDDGSEWTPQSANFRMWMVDNAKAVPFLIADAQENHRRIAELERLVAELRQRLDDVTVKRASLRP